MPKLFIPKERRAHETRVAAVPETVKKLAGLGFTVAVERGAGEPAGASDEAYAEAGASLSDDPSAALAAADLVLTVAPAGLEGGVAIDSLKEGAAVIGLLAPYDEPQRVARMAERNVSAIAMELIPRISRAQSMDALSSQANVGGYKAVLVAAARAPRFFPLLMTAAGTVRPARVVILGGGVAGLQALATAKRLGAVVEVSDIRPDVEEQVESLGGKFIELPDMGESGEGAGGYAREMGEEFLRRQREILTEHLKHADVVITTAQVPGKKAPVLLTRGMVEVMKRGAVVVDLAAEQGGNCELTRAGEEVDADGVLVLGPRNLPATVAGDASTLYARNLLALIQHMCSGDGFTVDPEDEIVGAALLAHGGEVVHGPTAERLAEVQS